MVFCDEYLSDGTYRDLLLSSRFGQNGADFVLLLHKGEWEEYLTAMRLGILDVLRSPLRRRADGSSCPAALAFERKERQNAALSAEPRNEITSQGCTFEELLERAAATLAPRSMGAAAGAADDRPAARRGVA